MTAHNQKAKIANATNVHKTNQVIHASAFHLALCLTGQKSVAHIEEKKVTVCLQKTLFGC